MFVFYLILFIIDDVIFNLKLYGNLYTYFAGELLL
jgi:hypothetical protein